MTLAENPMDKSIIRHRLLSLEAHELEDAREAYRDYLAGARLDRSEPIDAHDQSQAELASDLAEALDGPVHAHADKLDKLKHIDFGPKTRVEEGAVVTFGGRSFVVAVATQAFDCAGTELMGISTEAPIYEAIADRTAGERFEFNGRSLVIEDVR